MGKQWVLSSDRLEARPRTLTAGVRPGELTQPECPGWETEPWSFRQHSCDEEGDSVHTALEMVLGV